MEVYTDILSRTTCAEPQAGPTYRRNHELGRSHPHGLARSWLPQEAPARGKARGRTPRNPSPHEASSSPLGLPGDERMPALLGRLETLRTAGRVDIADYLPYT